jgi:acyl-CoA hydrolase
MSEGGVAIVALPATAKGGKVTRIVPALSKGASVTTARWHGPIVVTEFGYADLWGKNTRQRASALIEKWDIDEVCASELRHGDLMV